MNAAAPRVVDDVEGRRYRLLVDGEAKGELRYRRAPGSTVLLHAEVDPSLEGQGLGSLLVAAALDDIRARGERAVPRCPFVVAYLARHPEYADLVDGRSD